MNGALRLLKHVHFCLLDPAGLGGCYARRERFNISVFIDPQRRFLFTKNEKCGNNTARISLQNLVAGGALPERFSDSNRWFAPLLQPSDLGLAQASDINAAIPFKFAIVRNPYSRTLSCYLNKFNVKAGKRDAFSKMLGANPDMTFAEFVDRIAAQTPDEMNPHWRIQYRNIFCDVIRYDRFVRFENMDEEFGEILARFSQSPQIRNVRKGQYKAGEKIAEYYTPEIARAVHRTFAIDFETFGYPEQLPA